MLSNGRLFTFHNISSHLLRTSELAFVGAGFWCRTKQATCSLSRVEERLSAPQRRRGLYTVAYRSSRKTNIFLPLPLNCPTPELSLVRAYTNALRKKLPRRLSSLSSSLLSVTTTIGKGETRLSLDRHVFCTRRNRLSGFENWNQRMSSRLVSRQGMFFLSLDRHAFCGSKFDSHLQSSMLGSDQ
jgi:hypothetical protein